MTGHIRQIVAEKDFGFIESGKERDIFLHKSQYHGSWEGLREMLSAIGKLEVEFEVEETSKGLRANKCRLVGK